MSGNLKETRNYKAMQRAPVWGEGAAFYSETTDHSTEWRSDNPEKYWYKIEKNVQVAYLWFSRLGGYWIADIALKSRGDTSQYCGFLYDFDARRIVDAIYKAFKEWDVDAYASERGVPVWWPGRPPEREYSKRIKSRTGIGCAYNTYALISRAECIHCRKTLSAINRTDLARKAAAAGWKGGRQTRDLKWIAWRCPRHADRTAQVLR